MVSEEEFLRNIGSFGMLGDDDFLVEDEGDKPRPPFDELGIVLIDRSQSMGDPVEKGGKNRIDDVIEHLFLADDSFLEQLKMSQNSRAYSLAFIAFNTEATILQRPTPLSSTTTEFIPELGNTHGATDISKALLAARTMAYEWILERKAGSGDTKSLDYEPLVVIMLMSDGGHSAGVNPVPIADEIKKSLSESVPIRGENHRRGSIAVARYGDTVADPFPPEIVSELATRNIQDNKQLLQELASTPREEFHATPRTGAQLRNFFIKSVENIAKTSPLDPG